MRESKDPKILRLWIVQYADRIIRHLQRCGIDMSQTTWQTDNGSEFIGSWQAKDDSAFTKTIQRIHKVRRQGNELQKIGHPPPSKAIAGTAPRAHSPRNTFRGLLVLMRN